MNVDVANRLLQLRKERGLSQEDLAEKLGVTRQAVSKWERAEAAPDTDNLVRLAKLYGVSLDALLLDGLDEEDMATLEPPRGYAPETRDAQEVDADIPMARPHNAAPTDDQHIEFTMGDTRFRFKWQQFPYPLVVTLAYFLLGTFLNAWHPGWLLFLTIPFYYALPAMDRQTDRVAALKRFPYPVLVVLIYLCVGFFYHWWHPGWLLFLTIPLYYILLDHIV